MNNKDFIYKPNYLIYSSKLSYEIFLLSNELDSENNE